MNHAAILTLEFSIHEVNNGKMMPSSKKSGKSIGIIYADSQEACRKKIEEIIKTYELRTMEER